MSDSNVEFYNKYLSVLKGKYTNSINDMLHLETQNILLNEIVQKNMKEIEDLKKEIEELKASISNSNKPKKTSIKSEPIEEQF
jgi:predicted nuclease with TOPRIM domain